MTSNLFKMPYNKPTVHYIKLCPPYNREALSSSPIQVTFITYLMIVHLNKKLLNVQIKVFVYYQGKRIIKVLVKNYLQ